MKNSNIEWTDHTFNPWEGCTKVSPGCANCYAEARNQRFAGGANWGKGSPRKRMSAAYWKQPLKWNREAEAEYLRLSHQTGAGEVVRFTRPRVFCASVADVFDHEVPIEWLADLLDLIRRTPNLDWLLLTKRPENFWSRMEEVVAVAIKNLNDDLFAFVSKWPAHPPANVWIGTTVEDQQRADERIPELLKIPARVRFLSCEPLLGPVDLTRCAPYTLDGDETNPGVVNAFNAQAYHPATIKFAPNPAGTPDGIHWVICGGESGPRARLFNTEYAWDIVLQCKKAGVPVFVKQLGARPYTTNANAMEWPEHVTFNEVEGDSCAAGALIGLNDRKGGDFDEFPAELRVREFPEGRG